MYFCLSIYLLYFLLKISIKTFGDAHKNLVIVLSSFSLIIKPSLKRFSRITYVVLLLIFDFLKDKTAEKSKREFSLIEVACLLIHASKIDQNYTVKLRTYL